MQFKSFFEDLGMDVNRYVCVVLEEQREQLKHLTHLNLYKFKQIQAMMIEEVQTLVNRMEASLGDYNDYQRMLLKRRKLKAQIKRLEEKKSSLDNEES